MVGCPYSLVNTGMARGREAPEADTQSFKVLETLRHTVLSKFLLIENCIPRAGIEPKNPACCDLENLMNIEVKTELFSILS